MLKRPSTRRKSTREGISLNLVPIIDAMVTLIGFMLFTTSFISIVSIESPFPEVTKEYVREKLKNNDKPLQLTVTVREKDSEIWSPFGKISAKVIPHAETGQPDVRAIHEALIGVKQTFPQETKIVIVPHAGVSYDVLINVMDAFRAIEAGDPPVFRHNPETGNDEAVTALFPDVIFGNLLGDS